VAVAAAVYASRQMTPGLPLYLSAFVFGGFSLSQYSLVVSSIHDHLRPSEMTPASGTIVMLSGVVCIAGPVTVSFALRWFGLESFFLLMAGILALMALISIYRVITIPALPAEYKAHVVLQTPVSPVGSVLHPEEKEVVPAAPAEDQDAGSATDKAA
jgi:MFS family permease